MLKHNRMLRLIYPFYVKYKTKLRLFYMKIFHKMLSEDDLILQFPSLGIKPGDKVMIHSAGTKIGLLTSGPNTFVNAIKSYITKSGLIVMPSFPHRGMYEYLENYTLFDVNETPSKNGAITECFRKSEGVIRSAHPTHPLCAWGEEAEWFMQGHEKCEHPFDEKSPFKKLLDANIKILLIGVNLDHVTMTRVIEDNYINYLIEPYIPAKVYSVPVKLNNSQIVTVNTPCHDPEYFGKERNNMVFYKYIKNKIIFSHLGHAETWLFSSKMLYETQLECVKHNVYGYNAYRYKL